MKSHPHQDLFDGLIGKFIVADQKIPDGFGGEDLQGKVEILRDLCKGELTACMNQLINKLKEQETFKELGGAGKQAKMQADLIGYAAFKSDVFHHALKTLLQDKLKDISFNIENLNIANESIDSIVYKAANTAFNSVLGTIDGDVKILSFTSRPIPILKDKQDGLQISDEYKKDPLQKELHRHAFSILRYTDIKTTEALVSKLGEYIQDPKTDLGKAVAKEIQNAGFFVSEQSVVTALVQKIVKFITTDSNLKGLDSADKSKTHGNIITSLALSCKEACAQYRSRSMFQFTPLSWSLDSAGKCAFMFTAAITTIAALFIGINAACKYFTGSSPMSLMSNIGIAQGGAGPEQVIAA